MRDKIINKEELLEFSKIKQSDLELWDKWVSENSQREIYKNSFRKIDSIIQSAIRNNATIPESAFLEFDKATQYIWEWDKLQTDKPCHPATGMTLKLEANLKNIIEFVNISQKCGFLE